MFYNYLNNHEIYSHACNPSHFCDYPNIVVEESTEEEVVTPEEEPTEEDTVEETVTDEITTEEEVTE